MDLLTSCWLIIESIVIPDGFLKWFCLCFYIHPLLLFLCQIFLWVKQIQAWLLPIVSLPTQITCFVASTIFRFLTSIIFLFSFIRLNNIETVNDNSLLVEEIVREANVHVDEDISLEEYVVSSDCSFNSTTRDGDMTGDSSSNCGFISQTEDVKMNFSLPSVCSSDSPIMKGELIDQSREADLESFYQKYTDRMRWFDLLNHDRTCGISAILNKQLSPPCSFETKEQVELISSIPHISWSSKIVRSKLLRSLENDFELVYVAHSCLSWEALHYQYRKVEALIACSASQSGAFYDNVTGRFQKFQILLERFMEDERCEGKRYWNYVQRRSSLRSLLQVPQVSGYMEAGEDETKGEAMRASEVLNGIEKCIKTFWLYVKTDNKKPCWKIMSSVLWTCPPLEDPKDLELLADLTKTLQKKELWLKDLQGKKRCWLKRVVNPMEDSQKKEILFTMIDIKLVSRVLKMSMISTSQLKWCQEKLNNIEFKQGKVTRACAYFLFPSS